MATKALQPSHGFAKIKNTKQQIRSEVFDSQFPLDKNGQDAGSSRL